MANRYISTLSAVCRNDINRVGGKGANLGELAGKGFPVPSGFVVSAEAYSLFFASLRLQKILLSLNKAGKSELSRACGVIRNTITNASFPGELAESILAAHQRLIGNRGDETVCAVRSSATTEDLAEASFAGQHATYYYVERANLLRMIQYCWASLWSTEAVSYRNACGIEHSAAMAVVIQEMVCSEISGITFTANPVTGADEIVIEASWGMGAAIVDGRVTPDRYILDHDTLQLLDRRIAEKNVMVPGRLRTETSSRLTEVPPGLQQRQTLNPELLKTIAAWALKAEQHFGSPQNMEWAVAAGGLSILQSRPISSVGRRSRVPEPEGQYILFQPAGGPQEPFTPLTADLISLATSPLLRLIHGHCYFNLRYIRPFFPFRLSDQELADLFSGLYPARPLNSLNSLPRRKFSLRRVPSALLCWLGSYFLFGVFFARSRNMPENFSEQYGELCRTIEEKTKNSSLDSLLRVSLLPKIFDPVGSIPLWINISSMRHLLPCIPLGILLEHWLHRLPDLRSDALSLFRLNRRSPCLEAIDSALEQLAFKAGQFPSIRDQFLQRSSDQVLKALKKDPNARPFLQLFANFIEQHGYRAAKELELQSVRWEEHPNHVIQLIRDRLRAPSDHKSDSKQSEELSPEERVQLTNRIKQHLEQYPLERPFRPRWHLLLLLHKTTERFLQLGERSRSYHLMAMSVARKKLLGLEKAFLAQGVLKCTGDIFFLQLREIARIQQGLLGWPDIEDRIHRRRHDLIKAMRKTPASTVGIDLPDTDKARNTFAPSEAPRVILPGQTASPGSYTGRARVIMTPQEGEALLPGEILVTPYTDPSWTPLFLTAGGAVVEIGSYLSHAGTVAREYTLPCIVDVIDCTKRIQTGDLLWLDGEKGEVHILASRQPAAGES